jgi:hypothetical protein
LVNDDTRIVWWNNTVGEPAASSDDHATRSFSEWLIFPIGKIATIWWVSGENVNASPTGAPVAPIDGAVTMPKSGPLGGCFDDAPAEDPYTAASSAIAATADAVTDRLAPKRQGVLTFASPASAVAEHHKGTRDRALATI